MLLRGCNYTNVATGYTLNPWASEKLPNGQVGSKKREHAATMRSGRCATKVRP